MAGGNDIDGGNSEPEKVAGEIYDFSKTLIEAGLVKFIIITQVLNREKPKFSHPNVFKEKAMKVNELVENLTRGEERIIYWSHVRLEQRTACGADGVHLSDVGNYLLYYSLKKALAHVLMHLSQDEACRCTRSEEEKKRHRGGKNHHKR